MIKFPFDAHLEMPCIAFDILKSKRVIDIVGVEVWMGFDNIIFERLLLFI